MADTRPTGTHLAVASRKGLHTWPRKRRQREKENLPEIPQLFNVGVPKKGRFPIHSEAARAVPHL